MQPSIRIHRDRQFQDLPFLKIWPLPPRALHKGLAGCAACASPIHDGERGDQAIIVVGTEDEQTP